MVAKGDPEAFYSLLLEAEEGLKRLQEVEISDEFVARFKEVNKDLRAKKGAFLLTLLDLFRDACRDPGPDSVLVKDSYQGKPSVYLKNRYGVVSEWLLPTLVFENDEMYVRVVTDLIRELKQHLKEMKSQTLQLERSSTEVDGLTSEPERRAETGTEFNDEGEISPSVVRFDVDDR